MLSDFSKGNHCAKTIWCRSNLCIHFDDIIIAACNQSEELHESTPEKRRLIEEIIMQKQHTLSYSRRLQH